MPTTSASFRVAARPSGVVTSPAIVAGRRSPPGRAGPPACAPARRNSAGAVRTSRSSASLCCTIGCEETETFATSFSSAWMAVCGAPLGSARLPASSHVHDRTLFDRMPPDFGPKCRFTRDGRRRGDRRRPPPFRSHGQPGDSRRGYVKSLASGRTAMVQRNADIARHRRFVTVGCRWNRRCQGHTERRTSRRRCR